jgi:hypothetical protein
LPCSAYRASLLTGGKEGSSKAKLKGRKEHMQFRQHH